MPLWTVGLETMQRERRSYPSGGDAGWGADGRLIDPSVESTIDFDATVDPAPNKMAELLPEGTLLKDSIFIISETELRSDDDNSPAEIADHVIRGNDRYKVIHVQHFPRLLPHYEVLAIRVKDR